MLLFLHGFLGQKEDWDPLLSHFSIRKFPSRIIDLPGHGDAPIAEDIALTVKEKVPSATFVIGYSAGGRVALELKERFPNDYGQLILLSTHMGLTKEKEREKRWQSDQKWIEMLSCAPFDSFLEKWYGQKLFQSLKKKKDFSTLLDRRKQQNPVSLAQFLMQYSIAKKKPSQLSPSTILLYGEEDLKYAKAYCKLNQIYKIHEIKNAGHAIHLENPKDCATVIEKEINEYYRDH